MIGASAYLAWRSVRAAWSRSALLAAALGVAAGLPLVVGRALDGVATAIGARAQSTPLVAGPRGSPLDLCLRAMEFTLDDSGPAPVFAQKLLQPMQEHALVIPLALGARVRTTPVAGVPVEYFEFRALRAREGRLPALLGECVVGADAAAALDLHAGGAVTTTPTQAYDVSGASPLRLHVVGVLARTGTADDRAIFASLETAWTIAGIGHGHTELGTDAPLQLLLKKEAGHVQANASLREYEEVTPQTLASFHFHGDPGDFPVSAAILVPPDARAAAILRGRADGAEAPLQVARPAEVVDSLFARVFRVRELLAWAFVAVLGAAAVVAALMLSLVVRMRAPELALLARVGAPRGFVAAMLAWELAFVLAAAAACAAGLQALAPALEPLVRGWIGG
ncbi:MAG: hypothetical protein U0625_13515 [Phycisphaerales bacterium]